MNFSIKIFSLFIAIFFLTQPVFALDCSGESGDLGCVEFVRDYDGDTFFVDIPGVPDLFGASIGVRIRGIDTGEIKNYEGRTQCEYEMAVMAKRELAIMLESARNIGLKNTSRGKYFRVLADVYVDKKSVSKHLLKNHLAVPYTGGRKADVDWCKLKRQAEKKLSNSKFM